MMVDSNDTHKETLNLLHETLAYLQRMPPVPITVELCHRISSHLANPEQKAILERQRKQYGAIVSPNGVVQLEVLLCERTLTLHIPEMAPRFRRNLDGQSLTLSFDSRTTAHFSETYQNPSNKQV